MPVTVLHHARMTECIVYSCTSASSVRCAMPSWIRLGCLRTAGCLCLLQDPAEHGADGGRYQHTEMDHPTATS